MSCAVCRLPTRRRIQTTSWWTCCEVQNLQAGRSVWFPSTGGIYIHIYIYIVENANYLTHLKSQNLDLKPVLNKSGQTASQHENPINPARHPRTTSRWSQRADCEVVYRGRQKAEAKCTALVFIVFIGLRKGPEPLGFRILCSLQKPCTL